MKEEVFESILQNIRLPLGELLSDGTTYRVTAKNFHRINTRHINELRGFDKFLVLTNDSKQIIGGVLFYGYTDIQAIIFPKYRGYGFMSAICKNGILKAESDPNQKVTISTNTIKSFDDFLMKHHLVSYLGFKITNLAEIHKYFNMFKECDRFRGFQIISKEEFIKTYS